MAGAEAPRTATMAQGHEGGLILCRMSDLEGLCSDAFPDLLPQ